MLTRAYIVIKGAVQGVGFRPFIYNLAAEMNIKGYVLNSSSGVYIEAEHEKKYLDQFVLAIEKNKPPRAVITGFEFSFLDAVGYEKFEIRESKNEDEISALIMPDIAICDDCRKELLDPSDRRYRYPFINCTNCGPRFSIIESLPYDRPNTSMKSFEMCDKCREEYENPADRRFHAQPIACPDCGPQIELWNSEGNIISTRDNALRSTAVHIRSGKIIALKGLGGFQLIADASNDEAVRRLRERKHREEKPFALMFPDIELVKQVCEVSPFEERLIKSPESPIVLLKRKKGGDNINNLISERVAPGNPYLGIMLPYTPLHILLMEEIKGPVIATSGNISEEPICIDNNAAMEKLSGIADFYLTHNRPIVRHVDDSIARVVLDKEMVIRRARGYAPFPVRINSNSDEVTLAVGGHLKNTIALKIRDNVFVSQHIGDLSTREAYNTFTNVIEDFKNLYRVKPDKIAADKHPDYLSTKYAGKTLLVYSAIQHHFAHVASCMGENRINERVLGVSWDGTGLGDDNTVWGGEFFLSDRNYYSHYAQLKKFYLPGGERAVKEPRRSALGLLYSIYGEDIFDERYELVAESFSQSEISTLKQMLQKNINLLMTSSAGRFFDAAASILNLGNYNKYEGQAAMNLEFSALSTEDHYPFEINQENIFTIDWRPFIESLIADKLNKTATGIISGKFHNTLAQIILSVAIRANEEKVILSGGCFQNALLLEKTVKLLNNNGFKIYWHQRIPPNDGGISLGQIVAADIKRVPLNHFLQKDRIIKEIN